MNQGDGPRNTAGPGSFFSREALSSVPWLLIGKALTFFLYFAVSIVIVRGLGPAQYGVYSLLGSMADYLMVFCTMGLNQSLLRFVPELTSMGNRKGLKRFLKNSLVIQASALLVVAFLLYTLSPWISRTFHISFAPYIAVVTLFTAMLVSKEFLNNLLTSLLMARFLAFTSVGQGILFIAALGVLYATGDFTVALVIMSFSLSIAAMSVVAVYKIWQYLKVWKIDKPHPGIGRRRVLWLTLPMTFMAVTNKLLTQYSEIFFLGYYVSHEFLGYYSLALLLASQLLTFVPMALQTLFTSAFSEAYTRSQSSLGHLTAAVYQALAVVVIPLGCFGAYFAPQAIRIIYGEAMAPAGLIASFFCLFRILPMVWIPLSMALTATEKVANTMWLNVVHLIVNLSFDYYFISNWGIPGALVAIVATFLVITPLKLYVIRKLVGGLYIPVGFLLRIFIPSLLIAGLLYLAFPQANLLMLFVLSAVYAVLLVLAIRYLHLIRPSDTQHFKAINLKGLNRMLDFVTGYS